MGPLSLVEEEIDPITGLPKAPAVPAQAPEMNPAVKDHLMKKFNLGEYSDENRKKVIEDNTGYDTRGSIGAALMSLGGGNGMDALKTRDASRRKEIEDFDKGRSNKIQEYGLDREVAKNTRDDELLARESDPKSQESVMANELAASMGYKGPPITAQQFKSFSPVMQKKYEIEQRKLDRQEARDERRFQQGIKMGERQEARDLKREEKELALAVPGYERTGKVLPKAEEAAKFRKATAVSKQLQSKLDRMKQLVQDNGSFEYGGNGGTEMESLATEIQLLGKSPELYELGVLAGPDLKLLEKITASPTSLESLFTRDSSRQKQLDSQIESIKGKLGTTAESMGYAPEGGSSEKKKAVVKTQTNPKTGQKRVVYSDGSTEIIDPVARR